MKVTFAQPDLNYKEYSNVKKCLKSRWLTTGNLVRKFENKVGEYINSKYNIAVSSCTAAVHLSLIALGISSGDEVITSSMTFVSTVNVIEHCGATPIFVDVEKNTLNIDVKKIENAITDKTKAIIITHYAGQPCDLDAINILANKYSIPIIEDAAHAFGAKYKNKYIGNSNNLVCFSFYATKNITTGEGGMISTNNPKYVETIEMLRLHGMTKDAWNRYSITGTPLYDVLHPGYKYNMTDISAAIGLKQLEKSSYFLKRRSRIVNIYRKEIIGRGLPCQVLEEKNYCDSSNYLFTIILNEGINRDDLISKLKKRGVGVSVLFIPVTEFSYYKSKYEDASKATPVCLSIMNNIISLPLFTSMKGREIKYVIKILRDEMNG